jgi:hypothetical protein
MSLDRGEEMDVTVKSRLTERLHACSGWDEIIRVLFDCRLWDVAQRILDAPANVFDDPVTARLYDAIYEDQRADFLADIVDEVRPILLSLPPQSTVVEVGAGPGRLLLALASDELIRDRQYHFIGWDPSPEMLAISEEHRRTITPPVDVRFILGTSIDSSVQAALSRAALVLSRNVLSWIDDTAAECRRWHQNVPAGCGVYVREVRRDIPFEQFKRRLLECVHLVVHGVGLAYPAHAFASAYLRAFTPAELRNIIANAGFDVVERPPVSALASDCQRGGLAEMVFLGRGV